MPRDAALVILRVIFLLDDLVTKLGMKMSTFCMIFFRFFVLPMSHIFNMATVMKYIHEIKKIGTKNGGYR